MAVFFKISKHEGVLYEMRSDSDSDEISDVCCLLRMVKDDLPEFNTVRVSLRPTGDALCSVATRDGGTTDTIPDASFMTVCGQDYTHLVTSIDAQGRNRDDVRDMAVWHGDAAAHPMRQSFLDMFSQFTRLIEVKHMDDRCALELENLKNRVRCFRYIIDLPGNPTSLHLKPSLFSRRVVFVVDRDEQEYWQQFLLPWVHYVPVARDMSDLMSNLNKVMADPGLEVRIVENATQFAWRHLTRDACLARWRKVMTEVARRQESIGVDPIFALTVYTDNYIELFRKWLHSLPANFEPVASRIDNSDAWERFGFQTRSWYDIIRLKITFFADFLTRRPDGCIVMCSDSDIMFLDKSDTLSSLVRDRFRRSPSLDIWIMEEHTPGTANGGFYFVRNSRQVREFLRRAANSCFKRTPLADQDFINAHLHKELVSDFIPIKYVVSGSAVHLATQALVHHAIGCFNIADKLKQQAYVLKEVATPAPPVQVPSVAHRVPRRRMSRMK